MSKITFKEYQRMVEEQGVALLEVVQSVALGDLDVEVEVPEGIDVLSDLAIGLEMMIDDFREMMAEQERASAEIERGRQRLESTLDELLATQRRYLREQWETYTTADQASRGYSRFGDEMEPTTDAWLPSMTAALQQGDTVVEREAGLALPIQLYGETIGVLGFDRPEAIAWSQDEIEAAEAVVDQVAQALESQRLTDQVQQASYLLEERVRELDLLNEIGRKIDETPPVPEFLQWVAEGIPSAMQYPDLCVAAIEYEGRLYGLPEAMGLPYQMVHALRIGDQQAGKVYIAYTERREFLNAESAMLGDIVRRVSGYLENRRLFERTQESLDEVLAVQRRYLREQWEDYTAPAEASTGYLLSEAEAGPTADAWLPAMTPAVQQKKPVLDRDKERGATLALPIEMYGEVVGALGFGREGDAPWSDQEIATVIEVVNEVAEALDKQRLLDETQSALEQTEVLYAGSEQVVRATTIDEVLRLLVESTALRHLDRVSMAYFDRPWEEEKPDEAIIMAAWERSGQEPSAPVGTRYPLAQFPAIDTVAAGQETIIHDVATDDRIAEPLRALLVDRLGMRSLGLWPLVVGGQWVGLLNGQSSAPMEIGEGEVRQINSLVGQAASVIQTFRQVQETQARAQREQVLREITARVRGFTDPDALARAAVRELGTALGRPVFIRLGSAEELSRPPSPVKEGGGDKETGGE